MTTKPPPSPAKLAKIAIILECNQAIADYFKVPADHIISESPRKGTRIQDARALLAYHLYDCGMSFESIARLLMRSVDHIRRIESAGAIRMMGKDKDLLATLPRIPSTLEISNPKQ